MYNVHYINTYKELLSFTGKGGLTVSGDYVFCLKMNYV